MLTARQIADRVRETRRDVWEKANPNNAVMISEKLSREDETLIRQLVRESGYAGNDVEQMVRHVSELIVSQLEALSDDLPATGGD